MPDLKYYDVTREGQEYGTRMRLNEAGVKSLRALGATVDPADAPPAKGGPPARNKAAAASNKGAGAPATSPATPTTPTA